MVLSFDDPETKAGVIRCLKKGGIAIIPSDTIYGFAGAVPGSDMLIRKAKGRAETNPFLQLAPDIESVLKISKTEFPKALIDLWPGPVTMIFNDLSGVSLAVRVPDDPFLNSILKELDFFIYSTSVNRSGEPTLGKIQDIISAFDEKVDLIIDRGDLIQGKASTLIDIRERPFKILRQGEAVIPEELLNLS